MLDQEWIALILEAKQLGLSQEEIKEFLQQQRISMVEKVESK